VVATQLEEDGGGGQVFSFGEGRKGRLGHGQSKKLTWFQRMSQLDAMAEASMPVPRLIEGLAGKRVINLAAGGCHTAVVTEDGQCYTFGLGGYGQLGHGSQEDEHHPRLVEALDSRTVVQVCAAGFHTLLPYMDV